MTSPFDTYDWEQVFGYGVNPQRVVDAKCSVDSFSRTDVAHVIDSSEGYNDGPPWMVVGVLNDGRFFFIEACCDYTGWDCQQSGSAWVGDTLGLIARWGMTDEARERLPRVAASMTAGLWT